ncbi:hypothetical protein JZU68_04215 [bacterium]|jgi:hypothetical protein|nr:hypothetical protein [bacterium]
MDTNEDFPPDFIPEGTEFHVGEFEDRMWYGTWGIHSEFKKYCPFVDVIVDGDDSINVDENELKVLLNEYNLLKHFELFKDIANYTLRIVEDGKEWSEVRTQNAIRFNESIDLVSLMFQLRKKEIGWIEITPNIGNKFKITSEDILDKLGEILMYYFPRMEFCEADSEGRQLVPKKKKKLGKPNSTYPLASVCFMLLNILNNGTQLKAEGKIISNEQGRFIFGLLVLAKVLNPDSINVLEEDYIRSLIYNYKDKIPEI